MDNAFLHSLPLPSIDSVKSTERDFNLQFPDDYFEFLVNHNGGSPLHPVFTSTTKTGRPKSRFLLYLYGIIDEPSRVSLRMLNSGFHESDSAMAGHWVVGIVDDSHLILDCKKNILAVCDLNAHYGLPDGGLTEFIIKPFAKYLESLKPDPSGKWCPRNWLDE